MEAFIIACLLLTSVTAITFIVERGLALRERKVTPQPVTDAVNNYTAARDLPLLRAVCTQNPSPVSRLLLFSADHLDVPKAENSSLLETRARYELSTLERGLVVLEIIVGIAPLMGLVGTIYGLVLLFGSMDSTGAATDSARFAAGISTALNATLLGLLIAIPALVSWSYYSRKVETFAVRMESLCDEFLRKQYRSEGAAASTAAAAAASGTPPAMSAVR